MSIAGVSSIVPCNRCLLNLTLSHNVRYRLNQWTMSSRKCFGSWARYAPNRVLSCVTTGHSITLEGVLPLSRRRLPNIYLQQVANFSRQSVVLNETSVENATSKEHVKKPRGWIEPTGFDTGISIYNSLTQRKEPLILPQGRVASWYTCGPTVYDKAHIGHASAYVRQDILRRIITGLFNIDVVMVMGITDIDDKIIRRSKELEMDFLQLARHYEQEFFSNMASLKVIMPTASTRVTEHIPHIISFVQRLIDNGMAYRTMSGSVYFDVQKYGRYGRLWTHSMDTTIREAADSEKRSARDFALWKAIKPGEPFWDSPWGRGRPGWHIECSTMASVIFGEKLDIHSGGDDLKFPHHENEMAQSEACFCTSQWTNYWLHTGYLHQKDDTSKMSKSLKNTISVSDLLSKYTANEFRLFCMLRSYRKSVEYSEESMVKAVRMHSNWMAFLTRAKVYVSGQLTCGPIDESYLMESLEETKRRIESALSDDFDTPKVVSLMEELVKRANIQLDSKSDPMAGPTIRSPGVIASLAAYIGRLMDLFGLNAPKEGADAQSGDENNFNATMDSLMSFRGSIRSFALEGDVESDDTELSMKQRRRIQLQRMKPLLSACDELRDRLGGQGVSIQDYGGHSTWSMREAGKTKEEKSEEKDKSQKLDCDQL